MGAERRNEIAAKANTARPGGESASNERPNSLDVCPDQPIRVFFERIFEKASTATEKGRWFEHLFMAVARDVPDFQVADVWPWREWPDRLLLTGLDWRGTRIDLVAKLASGALVAIQQVLRPRPPGVEARRGQLRGTSDAKLNEGNVFDLRWVVSTCPWNSNAENAIRNKNPEVRRIDFLDFLDRTIRELGKPSLGANLSRCRRRPLKSRWTVWSSRGKTAASWSWPAAPARRSRPFGSRSGWCGTTVRSSSWCRPFRWSRRRGASGSRTIPPDVGARCLFGPDGRRQGRAARSGAPRSRVPRAVRSGRSCGAPRGLCGREGGFTYQSLDVVVAAPRTHDAPRFDLAVAEEAPRTTGVDMADRKVNFQHFHHRLHGQRAHLQGKLKEQGEGERAGHGRHAGHRHLRAAAPQAQVQGHRGRWRTVRLPRDSAGRPREPPDAGHTRSLEHADPKAKIGEADGANLGLRVPHRQVQVVRRTLSDNSTLKGRSRRLRGSTRAMDVKTEHLDADSNALVRSEETSTVVALLLRNACLLHKRLKSEAKDMTMLAVLERRGPRERSRGTPQRCVGSDPRQRTTTPCVSARVGSSGAAVGDDHAKKAVRVLAKADDLRLTDHENARRVFRYRGE